MDDSLTIKQKCNPVVGTEFNFLKLSQWREGQGFFLNVPEATDQSALFVCFCLTGTLKLSNQTSKGNQTSSDIGFRKMEWLCKLMQSRVMEPKSAMKS